jgi:dimethylhistidine N-methyltransferase
MMDAGLQSRDDSLDGCLSHRTLLAKELLSGLDRTEKYINSKFFYDERGSQLFDRITTLPEYYPTRTEIDILTQNAEEIADYIDLSPVLIEPGAGNCAKVRYLLESVRPAVYLPQDISADFLYQTAGDLVRLYPWLTVHPLIGDFSSGIALPASLPSGRRVVFYPGSTIGNFEPLSAIRFLRSMRELVGSDGGLIIGVDLQKDPDILNAAYNDSAGITAEFNLNILAHVNRILGTGIIVENFSHHAFYNTDEHRIEMHLVSECHQEVQCHDAHLHFSAGETIRTEYSYKYTQQDFAQLAHEAGFTLTQTWLDEEGLFSVHYLE